MGLECTVYMGAVDVARQELNVFRMRLLGAESRSCRSRAERSRTVNEAPAGLGRQRRAELLCLGSVMGPHPYPWMVRQFHRVIGDEARAQCGELIGR